MRRKYVLSFGFLPEGYTTLASWNDSGAKEGSGVELKSSLWFCLQWTRKELA
jgi:hypothetical protein